MSRLLLIYRNICCSTRVYRPINSRNAKLTFPSKLEFNLLLGIVPFMPSVSAQNEPVNVKNESDIPNSAEIVHPESEADSTTGWNRLKAMYKKDEFGNLSKELTAVLQSTSFALLAGLIYGGVKSSRVAFIDFMERNQATIFDNHLDAKRKLQNHMTVHFGKGALRWAIKLSVFTGGFMLFLTSLSVYRGETSILDYTLSGLVVGSIVRARLGPPAMIIGGLVGCFSGFVCGLTTKTLLNLTGSTLDDVISFQYEIDRSRAKLFQKYETKEIEKSLDNEGINLLKTRPPQVEEQKKL